MDVVPQIFTKRLRFSMVDLNEYARLSREHRALTERLCSLDAKRRDWDQFYATLWDFVAHYFGRRLENLCGIGVGDFLQGELTQYLSENNCDKLRKFLALKDDPDKPQHFFRKWFRMQIYAAYNRVFERVKKEIIAADPQLVPSSEKNTKETKEDSFKKYLTTNGRLEFASLVSLYWCKTPESKRNDGKKFAHELYTVVMFNLLGFSHAKIAALVGHADHIASAGSERNFWRTVGEDKRSILAVWGKATERIREVSAYSADAREEEDPIKSLGATLTALCFDGRHEETGRRWSLELHIPPKVEPGSLIRGIVQDNEGNVPKGRLFVCGKERKFRVNGCFEFPVSDFRETARFGEIYLEWDDGVRVDGVLHVPMSFNHIVLSRRMLEAWAARKMSEEDPVEMTAELLNDFGVMLPLLFLSDEALKKLPFEKFGITYPDRKSLKRMVNETYVLFRCGLDIDDDSPLSKDGFALPLEWRSIDVTNNILCDQLPGNLIDLSEKVKRLFAHKTVRLFPSSRFFDNRVDFSSPDLIDGGVDVVGSAFGALAVGLRHAERLYKHPRWTFASIAFDFDKRVLEPVSGIAQKIGLARTFGASRFMVAPRQGDIPVVDDMIVSEAHGRTVDQQIDSVAYSHLAAIEPAIPMEFKTTDGGYEEPRYKIFSSLSSEANRIDPDETNSRGPFVVLFGNPGSGKSIIMSQLHAYITETVTNKCFNYVCAAGRENQGVDFVKAIAYSIGCQRAGVLPKDMDESFRTLVLHGDELKAFYRKWVLDSLDRVIETATAKERFYILVDGLDEDSSGEILDLLTDTELCLPKRVSVVVSSRRIVQEEDRLKARRTFEIDLDGDDPDIREACELDLGSYIRYWPHRNRTVMNKLVNAGMSASELIRIILSHERSFLYAYYVLHGIAEGRYEVETLGKDIPADLKACFYDAFKARFPTKASYEYVRPLLEAIVKTGRVTMAVARRVIGERARLGEVVQALRGYVIEEGDDLVLSGKPLRDWLADDLHNVEFGISEK